MKILYFCNAIDKAGGLDRIIIEKANYLSKDNEVFIVTTNQKNKKYFYSLSNNIKHIDFSDYRCSNLLFSKKCFNKIIDEIKPDIIIVATAKESIFLPFFNHNIPKIKEIHFSKNHRRIQNKNSNFLKKIFIYIADYLEYFVAKMYDKLVVLTYEDAKNWNLNNTKVIYNFKTITSSKTSSLDNKNIIAVGRLDYQKGFDLLLKAWAIVKKNNKLDWKLNIYGEGKLETELKELAKKLNIDKSVIFHGNVKDIKSKYLNSSIYILSSRHEGLPLVLPEAMECGLPIVSFKTPCGPKDIITDNKHGYLVENYDISMLAKKILILINNSSLREQMGKEAKERAKDFDKDKIMQEWIELFKETIKSRKGNM